MCSDVYYKQRKSPTNLVELSGGSDGARTLMIETLRMLFLGSMSSKKSIIRCFSILASNGTAIGVTANHLPAYIRMRGLKLLNVMAEARVCDSWRSTITFHMRLFGSFSKIMRMTISEPSEQRNLADKIRHVLDPEQMSSLVSLFRSSETLILVPHSVRLLASCRMCCAPAQQRSRKGTFLALGSSR